MSRISSGTMTVAIFALLLGLAGAYTVRQYMQPIAKTETPPRPPANQMVAFASTNLIPGKVLSFGDIVVMSMSPEQIKRRKLPADAMTNTRFIIGRTLKTPLKKGDPFLTTDLYPEGMGPSVVERLKPGMRAVTIPISDMAAVSGFATPGSLVDVLFRAEEAKNRPETLLTIVESVEVLAYNQSVVPGLKGDPAPRSTGGMVTLAVTPQQGAALQVAAGHGDMTLALRNPEDAAVAGGDGGRMTLDRLMGVTDPSMNIRRLEIYHGGERQILEFEDAELTDERFGGRVSTPTANVRSRRQTPATDAPPVPIGGDRAGG